MQSKFNPPVVVVELKKNNCWGRVKNGDDDDVKIATRNELKPALIARVDFMASKFNLSGNWLHLIWMDVPQVYFYIYTFVANDRNDVPIIYLEMLHFYNDNDGGWLELLVSKSIWYCTADSSFKSHGKHCELTYNTRTFSFP